MLYLTRKIGDAIVIDDDIFIEVVSVKGSKVKLGISSNSQHHIVRQEVHKKLIAENQAAADSEI